MDYLITDKKVVRKLIPEYAQPNIRLLCDSEDSCDLKKSSIASNYKNEGNGKETETTTH